MAEPQPTRGVMFQYFEWNCPTDGSLWRQLAEKAIEIKNLGTTAVWTPPPFKTMHGPTGVGYAVYDLYDLGEFDQKGSVRTKYGTRDEFLAAVKAVENAGMQIYADIVLNHRLGADETEEVQVRKIDPNNRNVAISDVYTIRAWSKYLFPAATENTPPSPGTKTTSKPSASTRTSPTTPATSTSSPTKPSPAK